MPARSCISEPMSHNPSSSRAPACLRKWRCLSRPEFGVEQVWKLATSNAGDRLGLRGLGRVETNAPADILLFRRDPTEAISNISSLEAVVAAGKLYRVADLNRALQSSEAYFTSPLIKPLARRGAERALARAFGRTQG